MAMWRRVRYEASSRNDVSSFTRRWRKPGMDMRLAARRLSLALMAALKNLMEGGRRSWKCGSSCLGSHGRAASSGV